MGWRVTCVLRLLGTWRRRRLHSWRLLEVLGGILDKVADTEAAAAEAPGGNEPPPVMAGAGTDDDTAAHTAPVVVAPAVSSLQPVVPVVPAEAASDAERLSESGGALDVSPAEAAAASVGGDAAGEGGGEEGDGDDDDDADAADASLCAVDDDTSLLPAQPPTSTQSGTPAHAAAIFGALRLSSSAARARRCGEPVCSGWRGCWWFGWRGRGGAGAGGAAAGGACAAQRTTGKRSNRRGVAMQMTVRTAGRTATGARASAG
jgi:hypothetical protein